MSTNVGALRTPKRAAHPRMGEILEVGLVLAISLATIGVLAAVEGAPRVTPAARVAAIQTRADATSLAWRNFREIQATVDARVLAPTPEVAVSFEAPGADEGPLAWRSLKEMTAGIARTMPAEEASSEAPGADEGPLAWRSAKERIAGG